MASYRKVKKWLRISLYILAGLSILYYFYFGYPFRGMFFNAQRHGNPPLTPPWALECWLWEDDANTAERVDTLLNGYKKYDIPVRTILLDSPWSLRYNDFEIDTLLYPHPDAWFRKLQDDGYRVVCWMTNMVNSYSNDTRIRESEAFFKEASEKGYLAGNGEKNKWWKGRGGFIDYSNPEAMKWWRGRQQRLFDLGVDGWKLDGTATLFFTQLGPVPFPFKSTKGGLMTTRKYMDHYYRDEYFHGLTQNPEFVTLSRSIDSWPHPEGFAPVDAAPVTWVGDQKHNWESEAKSDGADDHGKDLVMNGKSGIEQAIQNILEASRLRYNVIGSDIAGFSGNTIPPRLYMRWTQFSAFCGLFLNGGHGERALWHRTVQELEVIRKFSWLHTELIPYMYSYIVTGHEGGRVLQKPVDGKYHYLFGEDFLVAPIYRDRTRQSVSLPAGNWRYLFDDKVTIHGPVTLERDIPLDEYPVFVREGAMVPMNICRSYTGFGKEIDNGFLTWLIYPGVDGHFTVHHPDRSGKSSVSMANFADRIEIRLTETSKPSILTISLDHQPAMVSFNNSKVEFGEDCNYDSAKQRLTVRLSQIRDGILVVNR